LGLLLNKVDVLGPDSESGWHVENPFPETQAALPDTGVPTQKGEALFF